MTIQRQRPRLIIEMVVGLFILGLVGCVGPAPKQDYSLAQVAIDSAREAGGARYAPGLYRQAEEYFRRAQNDYEERHYSQARENFFQARQLAERAENYSVLKKAENGESE